MSELAQLLVDVTESVSEVRTREAQLEAARERFRESLRAAHAGGANYALLGQLAGLTRQRIARIVKP